MSDIKLVPIRAEKMLIGISANNLRAVTVVEWSKKFGDRLACYHDSATQDLIEIADVTYHEFLELFMEYCDSTGRTVKILYKLSDNKFRSNLPKPRIHVFMYCS